MMRMRVWLRIVMQAVACLLVVGMGNVLFAQEAPAGLGMVSAQKTQRVEGREVGPADVKVEEAAAKEGDLVKVHYTITLEDGSLVYSTRPEVSADPGRRKIIGYVQPKQAGPEEIIAGKQAKQPGLGEALIGMVPGKIKQVRLSPQSAFGPSDPAKMQMYSKVKTFPSVVRMVPPEFVGRFRVFPVQGKEVQFSQFLRARVVEVKETAAVLEMIVKDGEKAAMGYGSVDIQRKGNEIVTTLTPVIGAPFSTDAAQGIITASDDKSFTVDFNPPLAGKTIVLDIEAMAITRASELADTQILWVEDHDKGLLAAKEAGKPAVMLLYADWCSWCKKLENETFPDPRIKALRDSLTFIKVNSDKQKELQKKYAQNGFPLVILFNEKGEMVGRIDGYKDAAALRRAIDGLINGGAARPAPSACSDRPSSASAV